MALSSGRSNAPAGGGRLYAELARLGITPIELATNLVRARVPKGQSATDLESALAAQGILVRGLANYALPEFIRISVGL
jgi:histidinol-phosphate aminotransferase